MAPSLRERVDPLGGDTGRDQGRDGAHAIAGGDPVVRQLRRRDRHPADLPTTLQLAAECRVQTIALAVEQLVVGDLSQECVSERVPAQALVPPTRLDQDPQADRRAEGIRDRLGGHGQHSRQEILVDSTARGRSRTQQPLRVVREARQPGSEDVAQLRREGVLLPVGLEVRRKLFDEERVAPGAIHDLIERQGPGCDSDQPTQQGRHVLAVQSLQVDPCDPLITFQFGDEGLHRIAAVPAPRCAGSPATARRRPADCVTGSRGVRACRRRPTGYPR